jgi:hypothetical protein
LGAELLIAMITTVPKAKIYQQPMSHLGRGD